MFSLLSLEKYCLRSPPPSPSPPIDRQQSNLLGRPVRVRVRHRHANPLSLPPLLDPISRSPKPLCRFETRCQSAGTAPRTAAGSPEQKSFVGLLKGTEIRGGRAFLMLLFGGVSEVHRDRERREETSVLGEIFMQASFRSSSFVAKSAIPMKCYQRQNINPSDLQQRRLEQSNPRPLHGRWAWRDHRCTARDGGAAGALFVPLQKMSAKHTCDRYLAPRRRGCAERATNKRLPPSFQSVVCVSEWRRRGEEN